MVFQSRGDKMANKILIDVDETLPEYKWFPLAEKFAADVSKECGWEYFEVVYQK